MWLATGACAPRGTLRAQSPEDGSWPIAVGDTLLNTRRILPGIDTLELLVVKDGAVESLSTLLRTVARTAVAGEPALRIVQEYHSARGVNVDTSVVVRRTLAPVRYAAMVNGEVQRIVFEPDRIRGTVAPPDGALRVIDVPLDRPVFNSVADEELIASLPLAEGFRAEFTIYNPPRAVGTVRIHVRGSERVATGAGPVDAWVIDYRASTGAPSVVWIERRSGKQLRRRVDLPNDAVWWMVRKRDLDVWRTELEEGGPTGDDRCATPESVSAVDPSVCREVEAFLHGFYRGFELADVDRMHAGMTEDYTGTLIIPGQHADPLVFDRESLVEGLRSAFATYAGREPRMEIRDVVVLPRSATEAVASFSMHFYLGERWINDAVSIADVRKVEGRWRMYRLYENKRR